jgi:hypothetical protein
MDQQRGNNTIIHIQPLWRCFGKKSSTHFKDRGVEKWREVEVAHWHSIIWDAFYLKRRLRKVLTSYQLPSTTSSSSWCYSCCCCCHFLSYFKTLG